MRRTKPTSDGGEDAIGTFVTVAVRRELIDQIVHLDNSITINLFIMSREVYSMRSFLVLGKRKVNKMICTFFRRAVKFSSGTRAVTLKLMFANAYTKPSNITVIFKPTSPPR